MLFDTHVHFLMDKAAEPDHVSIRMMLKYASRCGLGAICVMEHLDAMHYRRLIDAVFVKNILGLRIQSDGVLQTHDELRVFSGAEVSIKNGGDIGVHVSPRILLQLNSSKEYYSVESLRETLDAFGEPFVMVAHHMLLPNKELYELDRYPRLVDALEVPGKDPANYDRYIQLAASKALPVLSGSDAHVWVQVGAGSVHVLDDQHGGYANPRIRLLDNSCNRIQLAPDAKEVVCLAREYRSRRIV